MCCDDIPRDMLLIDPPPFFFKILGESLKKRAVDDPVPNPLPERAAIPLAALPLTVCLPEVEADVNPTMSPVEPLAANPPGLSNTANICCPHPFPNDEDEVLPCSVPRSSPPPPRASASFSMTDGLSQSLMQRRAGPRGVDIKGVDMKGMGVEVPPSLSHRIQ